MKSNEGNITKDEVVSILVDSFKIEKCILDSMLKVGGQSQFVIFKRIAACREMDRLQRSGQKKEDIYTQLRERFGYSRIYMVLLPKKYRENFFEFNICNK